MSDPPLSLAIPADEIAFEFYRSSGPGGQNVNKVETAVRLRFALAASRVLDEEQKARLARLAGRRVTADGELIIEASRHRTREKNREDALERLAHWVERALAPPRPRKKTKPSRAAGRRRLEAKRRTGERKRSRRAGDDE